MRRAAARAPATSTASNGTLRRIAQRNDAAAGSGSIGVTTAYAASSVQRPAGIAAVTAVSLASAARSRSGPTSDDQSRLASMR